MSRCRYGFATLGSLSLTLALVSACGGQSYTRGNEGGTENGGTAQGGSNVTGGTAQGGSSYGGTGQAGFGATGATGAIGGTIDVDFCSAPPVTGQCDAYFQRWYHDPVTNQCRTFVWGGCGGNSNNYTSLAECQAACGGQADPKACSLPSDCAVGSVTSCAVCDGPNVSANQLVAYNKQYASQYLCVGVKTLPPPDNNQGAAAPVACQPCPAPLPGQGTLKYFVPDCVQGQCVVSDLRTSPLTACMTAAECRLRNGTECCERCGGEDLVAVRNDGSFEAAACGPGDIACDACAYDPPPTVIPYCNATGHCEAIYQYPAGG